MFNMKVFDFIGGVNPSKKYVVIHKSHPATIGLHQSISVVNGKWTLVFKFRMEGMPDNKPKMPFKASTSDSLHTTCHLTTPMMKYPAEPSWIYTWLNENMGNVVDEVFDRLERSKLKPTCTKEELLEFLMVDFETKYPKMELVNSDLQLVWE